MNKFLSLAFIVAVSILGYSDAQTGNLQVCEADCSEDLRITCDELVEAYRLQGTCCSLEPIPAYNGCRVRVGGGNCYWTPKCGGCPNRLTDGRWPNIKCNMEYRSEVGSCPTSEYPTNWRDFPPTNPSSDAASKWAAYSCSPSMAPAVGATRPPVSSSATSNSLHVIAVLGSMVMAVAQQM